MRYRLRTLMIVLALGPPVLALAWLALPMIHVEVVAVVLIASLIAFSVRCADLSHEATLRSSDRLKREIREYGNDKDRKH